MELRTLTYFLAVAREKTISQAATYLNLSQPALSKQLKELEKELGVQLFIRGNRQITLTEEGIYLKNRGEEILSLVDTTTTSLKSQKMVGGNLSIGSGETRAFELIAELLNRLMKDYPEINAQIYSGNSDDIMWKIDKGLLDFGLVIDPVDKQKYDFISLPHTDVWGVMVNKHHVLANYSEIRSKDLIDIPLLISSQSTVDSQLTEWLGTNSDQLKIIGTYNLLYNASLLSKTSDVAVLCLDGIVNIHGTDLTFIELSPNLISKVSLVWKKEVKLLNTAQVFLDLLEKGVQDK